MAQEKQTSKQDEIQEIILDDTSNEAPALKKTAAKVDKPAEAEASDTQEEQESMPQEKTKETATSPKKMSPQPKAKSGLSFLMAVVVVLLGTASGYGLNQAFGSKGMSGGETAQVADALPTDDSTVEIGKLYGSDDEEKFPDSGEGVLMDGGFKGEGSHRILREGGPTQTIYVTSSTLVLDPYIGHKVKVWGETFAAQNVSWLMDVGGVEVVELDAEPPFEEEGASVPEDELEASEEE